MGLLSDFEIRFGFRILSLIKFIHVGLATVIEQQSIVLRDEPSVAFSPLWHLLGPFQIGTRESEWGSDPLDRYGGFQEQKPDEKSSFRSSLSRNGTINWSTIAAFAGKDENTLSLSVSFPHIDWDMMQMAYGWSGLQFQAWLRGHFETILPSPDSQCSLVLHTKQVLEVWIDGEHYFGGDVYGYQKSPIVLPLEDAHGQHVIEIRAFNDIRMFGGRNPPRVDIDLVYTILCDKLTIEEENSVFPDIVNGKAAGKHASISVRNNSPYLITITDVQSKEELVNVELIELKRLESSQSRPIKLQFETHGSVKYVTFLIKYDIETVGEEFREFRVELGLQDHLSSPHKYTYLHPSGIVSYGIIRPPLESTCTGNETLPVLLALHGAGVDTNSDMARNSFEGLPKLCAWLVIPSGVTPWSGDDWHIWGLADVEAAVEALQEWITTFDWNGPKVDFGKWFISGHSNGGQGAWFLLINRNDKAIGGTPLAGYLSIPGYVPYSLWTELEPRASSVLQSSMNTYRLDLLAENLAGTPILQGHGEKDDNVPVFHSRRMFELRGDVQLLQTENPDYYEFEGKGHWFEGIMTHGPIGEFLSSSLSTTRPLPPLRQQFTITVGNPSITGSRGGIRVLQLADSGTLGRIKITLYPNGWFLHTVNVRRFEIDLRIAELRISGTLSKIYIDGTSFQVPRPSSKISFVMQQQWETCEDEVWKESERHEGQLGGLHAVYNSKERFIILHGEDPYFTFQYQQKAKEISRNLFQYYSADTEIMRTEDYLDVHKGSIVLLGQLDLALLPEKVRDIFPISISHDGSLTFQHRNGESIYFPPAVPGLGLIFLFPVKGNDRVGIFIWGSDPVGIRRAARLFPFRTGVCQPDFILLGPESGWRGAAGAIALGTFDSDWQISEPSYFKNL